MRWLALIVLFMIGAAGSPASPITAFQSHTIAYTAITGQSSQLWLLNVDTGGKRRLTRAGSDGTASWSSDGTRLVFDRNGKLAVLTPATGAVRALTSGNVFEEEPAWSPDGRWIAWSRTVLPSGTATAYSEIWRMRPSGRDMRQLTHNGVNDYGAAWSPSGRQIAFVRIRSNSSDTTDVWLMRSNGSGQRRFLRDASRPAWSPDGRWIAYSQPTRERRGCCRVTNLRLVSADGRHRRLLLRNGGRPAWSPDGQRIVFQRFTGSRQHLWIVNQDGSGLRRLTGASGEQYAAAWRRG